MGGKKEEGREKGGRGHQHGALGKIEMESKEGGTNLRDLSSVVEGDGGEGHIFGFVFEELDG